MAKRDGQYEPDRIGYWSELKLEIIRSYASAYSRILAAQPGLRHAYIDAFAGGGQHLRKKTLEPVAGSPVNALAVRPPFKEYHFIDLDGLKADALRQLAHGRSDVDVYEEDCNVVLLNKVFPRLQYRLRARGLCLLDPYDLDLDWNVVATAGRMQTIEIFLNFMVMDMNMNVLWKNPDKVSPQQIERMDRFWGDESWRSAAYREESDLFGTFAAKSPNDDVAQAYRERLRTVGGFANVAEPLPMRNDQGAVVYYLFFASPNPTGLKIVNDIFGKYRERGRK